MIGIPLGLLYANATEWAFHKYVLHGVGKNRASFWSFHWHDHHKNSRQHGMLDDQYDQSLFSGWNPQTKEVVAMATGALVHLPLVPVAPFFVGTVLYSGINYYRVHKKSHVDEEWAKEHLPWHWDHHMAPDQDANWGVTRPWFDQIFGTRKVYLGTQDEIDSRSRREKVQERYKEKLRALQEARRKISKGGLRARVSHFRLARRERKEAQAS
ncbi:MAG: sterol desaturase family protein [Deltaproteobacteria bacterium]|nr:sterol desaturase family protein [Deltaproteobacteria bacterium]